MIADSVDASQFHSKLKAYVEATGRSAGAVIKEQATLAAKELLRVVPPTTGDDSMMKGKEALNVQQRAGKAAVSRDVHRVFMERSEAFKMVKDRAPKLARKFYKLLTTDFRAAIALVKDSVPELRRLESVGPLKADIYHRYRSKNSGRVTLKYQRHLVTERGQIKAFVTRRQQMVGTEKSGVVRAAQAAGIRITAPAWISSKRGTGTGINKLEDKIKPFIQFKVTVPWAHVHNKGDRLLIAVMGNRARAMQRKMDGMKGKGWKR